MKLRKKLIALSALTLSLIMVVPVFADNPVGWQKNETGWWYGTNATGTTWYHDGWQWIDGNKDGFSECYYFAPNGYIVTNGKTPDGYYVNKRGVLEIDGREVTHCEECIYIASSIDVPDKNHVDLSKYNDWEIGIGHCWSMTAYPFGKLVYNHVTGMDREQGGIDSNIVSHNDFGVCAVGNAENSYKHTKK